MTRLFDLVQAGGLQLAHRIVMAPLTRNRAPGALPTPLNAPDRGTFTVGLKKATPTFRH